MMHQLNGKIKQISIETVCTFCLDNLLKCEMVFSFYRYDRFKNSEKTEDGDVSETDAEKDVDNKSETVEQNGTESNI